MFFTLACKYSLGSSTCSTYRLVVNVLPNSKYTVVVDAVVPTYGVVVNVRPTSKYSLSSSTCCTDRVVVNVSHWLVLGSSTCCSSCLDIVCKCSSLVST